MLSVAKIFRTSLPSYRLAASQHHRKMATASTVSLKLPSEQSPAFYLSGIGKDQAKKTSELLQENHEKHHIFFNKSGFHNHIAHHLPTLYALNADTATIQKQYDLIKSYQRPPVPLDKSVVKDLKDVVEFKKHLGNERYYNDYLVFFQNEMNEKGWQNAVNEYLFSRDDRADDMLARLYGGFLHPLIHLGFGVEFEQPAIVAEALAQTAVHDNWMKDALLPAEQVAADLKSSATIVDLLEQCRAAPELRSAAESTSNNRLRDGILAKESSKMTSILSQYKITSPSGLALKTAEMTNAAAFFTGASQRPSKEVKMDFYYLHCINSSIFFSSFLKQEWIKDKDKIRLLEWKVRTDVALYASRGSPELYIDEIKNYTPKKPCPDPDDPWKQIFERICAFEDDGHGAKLVRAFAHGERICKDYGDRENFVITGDMWLKLGHMAIDSVEAEDGIHWVRSTGFDEAWKDVPDRKSARAGKI